jgi:hypothetical protein
MAGFTPRPADVSCCKSVRTRNIGYSGIIIVKDAACRQMAIETKISAGLPVLP